MVDAQRQLTYTLGEIAEKLDVDFQGNAQTRITGLATLDGAEVGDLSFLANPKYQQKLLETRASAVLLHPSMAEGCPCESLLTENPYLAFARATHLFDIKAQYEPGVHPSASVSSQAEVGKTAMIGPHCTLEAGVVIEDGVRLGSGCFVGANSRIGANSHIHPNVSIYHGVRIGQNAIVHSGAVIGADGFGFAPSDEGWVKIVQLGGVSIGDDVEIGAGTTIDRGALEDTYIDNGVILDNQVQVAHNVRIGKNTAIAGCTAIAGSTSIGANCTIAGAVGIIGHLTIADKVHITAMSLITKSIKHSGSYSSGTVMMETARWRKSAVRFGQLDRMYNRLSALETANENEISTESDVDSK